MELGGPIFLTDYRFFKRPLPLPVYCQVIFYNSIADSEILFIWLRKMAAALAILESFRFEFELIRESEITNNLLNHFRRNSSVTGPIGRKQPVIADDVDQSGNPPRNERNLFDRVRRKLSSRFLPPPFPRLIYVTRALMAL